MYVANMYHNPGFGFPTQAVPLITQIRVKDGEESKPASSLAAGLAACLPRLGCLGQAARHAEHALRLSRDAGFLVVEGLVLVTLAEIRIRQRRVDQADDLVEEALLLGRRTGHRGLAVRAARLRGG